MKQDNSWRKLKAAYDTEGNWFHVKSDGSPAYSQRYKWVGNFDEDLAWVQDFDGNRFKINKKGERVKGNDTR
jgi:hypothetical protein